MEITDEYVAMLKSRDVRYRLIEQAIVVDREVSESPTIKLIREQAAKEAADALEMLATIHPQQISEIIRLQSIVFRMRFIDQTIGELLKEAQRAQVSLRDDHTMQDLSAS